MVQCSIVLRWLISLMVVATVWSVTATAVVHAREWQAPATLDCMGDIHIAGDADQSEPAPDGIVPHHHGSCHGPALDLRAVVTIAPSPVGSAKLPRPSSARSLTARVVDPALRPPTA